MLFIQKFPVQEKKNILQFDIFHLHYQLKFTKGEEKLASVNSAKLGIAKVVNQTLLL